eukprot:CAMPEP_0113440990 /NCGR_PEP_ID=MMETSP0014_2-20120614/844_1 /TAXON_ID=2857 /ORGANISM="Nitzschia sp." /LENGTH=389 /DNA_ID=CAMNT_0000331805 /DNA_START=399 /DNA_END=1568 /DNA_ORIENTATION=+ /assembly_acc=CAM_ASM_000159
MTTTCLHLPAAAAAQRRRQRQQHHGRTTTQSSSSKVVSAVILLFVVFVVVIAAIPPSTISSSTSSTSSFGIFVTAIADDDAAAASTDVDVNVDIYNLDVTDHFYEKKDIISPSGRNSNFDSNNNGGGGGPPPPPPPGRKRRHEITVDKYHCRDSFHFDCDAVWNNDDCETTHSTSTTTPSSSSSSWTNDNPKKKNNDDVDNAVDVVIGDVYCPATCGRCTTDRYNAAFSPPSSSSSSSSSVVVSDQNCYTFAKQHLNFTFVNVEPQREDWIGIYNDDVDLTDLGPPVSWYWLCDSNKRDKCKASRGVATFPWLPPGKYKAVLSQNPKHGKGPYAAFGPFSAFAASEAFEVVRNSDGCAMRRRTRRRINQQLQDEQHQHQNLFLRGGGPQ